MTVAAAAATLGSGLIQGDLWHPAANVRGIVVVVALVLAMVLSLWDFRHEQRRAKRRKRRQVVLRAARSLLLAVQQETEVRASQIGVSIFEVRGMLLPHLQRRYSDRLVGTPGPAPIIWTKGKGVIGMVWKRGGDGRVMHADLRPQAARFENQEPTDEDWQAIVDAGRTMGLSRVEYGLMVHRYGEVLAMRYCDSHGTFKGVIAVDVALKHYRRTGTMEGAALLTSERIEKALQDAAADLGGTLEAVVR